MALSVGTLLSQILWPGCADLTAPLPNTQVKQRAVTKLILSFCQRCSFSVIVGTASVLPDYFPVLLSTYTEARLIFFSSISPLFSLSWQLFSKLPQVFSNFRLSYCPRKWSIFFTPQSWHNAHTLLGFMKVCRAASRLLACWTTRRLWHFEGWGWNWLTAVLILGVFNGPKKYSNYTQFIQGFKRSPNLYNSLSAGRVHVWVQVQAPACHLTITPQGYDCFLEFNCLLEWFQKTIEGIDCKINGQAYGAVLTAQACFGRVGQASTNTGRFQGGCNHCWQRASSLEEKVLQLLCWFAILLSWRVKKVLMIYTFQFVTRIFRQS